MPLASASSFFSSSHPQPAPSSAPTHCFHSPQLASSSYYLRSSGPLRPRCAIAAPALLALGRGARRRCLPWAPLLGRGGCALPPYTPHPASPAASEVFAWSLGSPTPPLRNSSPGAPRAGPWRASPLSPLGALTGEGGVRPPPLHAPPRFARCLRGVCVVAGVPYAPAAQ